MSTQKAQVFPARNPAVRVWPGRQQTPSK